MTEIITAINPNPAQNVSVNVEENFNQFATRIYNETRPLLFANGEAIELNPESKYCIIALELSQIATPEQFAVLYGAIMGAVAQAEAAGAIPPGWFRNIATLFNLNPPVVPERFSANGEQIKITWQGEQRYLLEPVLPEPVLPEPVVPEQIVPENE